VLVIALISVWTVGAPESSRTALDAVMPDTEPTKWASVKDASEIDGITQVNLWADYENRTAGISGSVAPGQAVRLVEKRGEGCLIDYAGTRGWVGCDFIREWP
jgi:hypothetical protein